jgi:hypothetical protein
MKTIRLSLRNVLGITLMATAIVAVSSTSAHAQLVWDLRNDFSLTGSPTATESDGIGPDGAWSFHMDDDGTEVLFDDTGESKFSGGDLLPPDQAWNSTLGGADPNNLWVAKADIAGTDTPSGDAPTGFDILAGEINMAPLAPSRDVILRWTAPFNMQVSVEGIVWGAHTGQMRNTSFDITHTDSSGTPYSGGVGNVVATTPYVGNDSRVLGNPFGGFTDPIDHPTILPGASSPIELPVNAGDRLDLKNYVIGNDGTISGVEFIINQTGGSIPTSFEWVADTLGNWSESSNWTPGIGPPNTADQTAVFGNMTSGPTTAVLTSDVTVNRIQFDSSNSYAIGGLSSVTLAESTGQEIPRIDVMAGDHQFQAEVALANNTTVDVASGATVTFNNQLGLGGNTLDKIGDGTMRINNVLGSGGGTVNCLAGTCSGNGTISGNLANTSGTVAPGNSPGILTVDGDFTQGSAGTLALEIGGLIPGEEHDKLVVNGIATLDGTLDVTLINGFTLAGDMLFDVLDFNSVVNDFSTFNLPPGLVWDVSDGSLCFGTCTGGGLTDYDNDGTWGLGDLNLVLFNWNEDGATLPAAWINSRPSAGTLVGLPELNQVLFSWGQPGALATVPEPGTLVLLLGLVAFAKTRRN